MGINPILSEKYIHGRYRLYPIIVGHRCGGFELQKEYKTFFGTKWKPVYGEMGIIRCLGSDKEKLIKASLELELLAKHLSTITIIEFSYNGKV